MTLSLSLSCWPSLAQAGWTTRSLEPGKSNAVCKDPFIEGANSLRTLSPKHLPRVREVRQRITALHCTALFDRMNVGMNRTPLSAHPRALRRRLFSECPRCST